jgi:hypothetical protein
MSSCYGYVLTTLFSVLVSNLSIYLLESDSDPYGDMAWAGSPIIGPLLFMIAGTDS